MNLNLIFVLFVASVSSLVAETVPTFFFPFGREINDTVLIGVDDGATPGIILGVAFPFFGTTQTELFVGYNGYLSFQTIIEDEFGGAPFPYSSSNGPPLIAVYWGDVSTTLNGCIFYRLVDDDATFSQINEAVLDVYATQGLADFTATLAFVATYNNVGTFANVGINNFQVAIATDGTYSFAVFHYCTMEWADFVQVGFDAGDQTNFYSFPTALTANIINIGRSTNSEVTGRYVFRIDSQVIDVQPIMESVFIGVTCVGGCYQDDGITYVMLTDNFNCIGVACVGGCCQDDGSTGTCTDNGVANCEDDCIGVNCNNGTCVDGLNDFTCSCNAGFTGELCETNIDECATVNCNNGICIDGINGFTCECNCGWKGEFCDQPKGDNSVEIDDDNTKDDYSSEDDCSLSSNDTN